MPLPICTPNGSGKLRSPLILEKEKNHVSEENLDVSMASDAVYLEIPWSRGRTIF